MSFEVVHISRGDMRLKSEDKHIRVLGEALIASAPSEPSYVIYLNSLTNWEVPSDVALTKNEKQDVVNAIQKHFRIAVRLSSSNSPAVWKRSCSACGGRGYYIVEK